MEPFVPAAGLSNPHAQTLLAYAHRPRRARAVLQRERWETPDGDFVDVDRLPGPGPRLLVLHGLEGSSRSGYVQVLLDLAAERGWGAIALNFRSCSGVPNRLLRSYSSGETADPRWVLSRMRAEGPGLLLGVGFSLGGNALLKLLAEDGEASALHAAVAVSVPFDLALCARNLDALRGPLALYRHSFLRSLKAKALEKVQRFPGQLDANAIRRARGVQAFDDAVTAPLSGYPDAQAYYRGCSSGSVLEEIRRPTLLISAHDDPLVPRAALPAPPRNPRLTLCWTEHGGHVGFIQGSLLRPRYWAEARALEFLADFVPPRQPDASRA